MPPNSYTTTSDSSFGYSNIWVIEEDGSSNTLTNNEDEEEEENYEYYLEKEAKHG